MLTLNLNPNLGNQSVRLSDGTLGQLSGIRSPQNIQWIFSSLAQVHEGFIYAGPLNEGQIIDSMNKQVQYKIHFT